MRSRKKRILELYEFYRIFREELTAGWRGCKSEERVSEKRGKRQ